MLELMPVDSESEYAGPVGLDENGVVYIRRKRRKLRLGYDMHQETVPYEKVRSITLSEQSKIRRILGGVGMILADLRSWQ